MEVAGAPPGIPVQGVPLVASSGSSSTLFGDPDGSPALKSRRVGSKSAAHTCALCRGHPDTTWRRGEPFKTQECYFLGVPVENWFCNMCFMHIRRQTLYEPSVRIYHLIYSVDLFLRVVIRTIYIMARLTQFFAPFYRIDQMI